jgi:hypothetical protein
VYGRGGFYPKMTHLVDNLILQGSGGDLRVRPPERARVPEPAEPAEPGQPPEKEDLSLKDAAKILGKARNTLCA